MFSRHLFVVLSSFARQNIVLMDHLLNTIVLICQNPKVCVAGQFFFFFFTRKSFKVPQEVTQYWIVSAVHLLKLIKGTEKNGSVGNDLKKSCYRWYEASQVSSFW